VIGCEISTSLQRNWIQAGGIGGPVPFKMKVMCDCGEKRKADLSGKAETVTMSVPWRN
jgi:hypothetical protein